MPARARRARRLPQPRAGQPEPRQHPLIFHGFAIQGADPGSAQFGPAMQACQHLLPNGTPSTAAELHQEFIQGLKAARCMGSHGYPTWPDPTDKYGYNTQPLPPANIDTSSRQFQAAAKACGIFLPSGGGG